MDPTVAWFDSSIQRKSQNRELCLSAILLQDFAIKLCTKCLRSNMLGSKCKSLVGHETTESESENGDEMIGTDLRWTR